MPLHQEGSVRRHFNEMIEKEAKKHAAEFEPASSQLQGVFSTAMHQLTPNEGGVPREPCTKLVAWFSAPRNSE